MIELNPIYVIQKEYLSLLEKNTAFLNEQSVSDRDLHMFFEEISIFWRERSESIRFFLNNIEFKDKCSFLAGAMYIDIENDGHYEFAVCGRHHIFTDPVTKMMPFFHIDRSFLNREHTIEYLTKVVFDCIKVLNRFPNMFIVLPLSIEGDEDSDDRISFLKDVSFSCISNLLKSPCKDDHEFIQKYSSFEEIESDIADKYISMLILNDENDVTLSIRDRITKNLKRTIVTDFMFEQMGEPQIFLMAYSQYFMQVMDIVSIAFEYQIIPFVRSEITFKYLFGVYENFSDNFVFSQMLQYTAISYVYMKVYRKYEFSNLDFCHYNYVLENNDILGEIVDDVHHASKNVFELSVPDLIGFLDEKAERIPKDYMI